MAQYEQKAMEGNDNSGSSPVNAAESLSAVQGKGKVIDLVLPVLVLIVFCVFALLYVGGWCEGKGFIEAFGDTDATVGLPWGAMLTMIIVIVFFCGRKLISFKEAMKCIPEGCCAMVPAILILTLATALKNVSGALELREFIAGLMSNQAPALAKFLPAVIFFIACMLAFSTGTSWGTFGILIPIVISTFDPQSPLLYIGMSACLAGAVCGDHCSPISDTTIMSSAGAKCDHVTHVSTQLPYSATVAVISFISFLISGFCNDWFIVFPIAVLLTLATLLLLRRISRCKCKCCK
jgi:Na+/H+ antiporter NhaC